MKSVYEVLFITFYKYFRTVVPRLFIYVSKRRLVNNFRFYAGGRGYLTNGHLIFATLILTFLMNDGMLTSGSL